MLRNLAVLVALIAAAPAGAQELALVIGNENYAHAADISAADDAIDAADALRETGFTVLVQGDMVAADMHPILEGYYARLGPVSQTVILLAGHFATAGGETWFLGTDVKAPTLAGADLAGLSLATVLLIAAEKPGGALVLLGTDARDIALGKGLTAGIGALDIPPGVAVIYGDAGDVAEFAGDVLTRRGQSLSQLVARRGGLRAEGTLIGHAPFLRVLAKKPVWPLGSDDREARIAEREAWRIALSTGTKESLATYLRNYPNGTFAAFARQALNNLTPDPIELARQAEDALRLSRDQRRLIQRDLTLLGFDTRGIDGVFGRGSRAAIAAWQKPNGHAETGYVSREQIAQLAAQAEARRAEAERQDRLFWDQTGAGRDEAGLRAYLKRFPDGLFADIAQTRLAIYDRDRRDASAAADRAAWDRALRSNTVDGMRAYLDEFPQGAFAEDARQFITDQNDAPENAAAKKIEDSMRLNPGLRTLVEQRLRAQGLDPGPVDGVFDADTRRALRRYQTARGLQASGYLDQLTLVRLLADAL